MIEIKGLTKVYKPKKGVPVKALDGVDLKIEEKGMVFILGKSGSGKSTLLNLLGGLDKYDSGEIIIKGKSSKDFSQSEFDSYRNTYLGFIFQEYNILNEFSVGANIALAMELQGKKATHEALNNLLKTVDLEGYGSRKPNELSGGQKQRVAIARALIKDPEIIMADEPTGALDSNTGKQVFETLQKLSKEKLVIIVSHDREFAEYYGDRVIEMADGKIISDIVKYKATSDTKSEGVSVIDDKILHIKKGYELTASDLALINGYLKSNSSTDTIISLDEKSNLDFKKVSRIDDEGNRDAFKGTNEGELEFKQYENSDFKLIKSKLPPKNAIKIGASGLKAKPVRLFFTVLLSAIAFALFGIANTMGSYDKITAATASIKDANINYVAISKSNVIDQGGEYSYKSPTQLTDKDVETLKAKFPELSFVKVYNKDKYNSTSFSGNLYDSDKVSGSSYYSYYTSSFSGMATLTNSDVAALGFKLTGNLPSAANEIIITDYAYRHFVKAGYKNDGNSLDNVQNVTSPQQLLNKTISLNLTGNSSVDYKIVGILDTNFDDTRYAAFRDEDSSGSSSSSSGLMDYMLMQEMSTVITKSFHSVLYINSDLMTSLIKSSDSVGIPSYGDRYNINFGASRENLYYGQGESFVLKYDEATKSNITMFDSGKTNLTGAEALIPLSILNSTRINKGDFAGNLSDYTTVDNLDYYNNYFTIARLQAAEAAGFAESVHFYGTTFSDWQQTYPDGTKNQWLNNEFKSYYSNYVDICYDVGSNAYVAADNQSTIQESYYASSSYKNAVKTYIETYFSSTKIFAYDYSSSSGEDATNVSIVGYYNDTANNNKTMWVISSSLITFDIPESGIYTVVLSTMPSSAADIKALVEYTYNNGVATTSYDLNNAVSASLEQVNEFIEMFSKVFLYIGLGFAIFAALMLMNYISTSISYKKREIGILRAVGARGADVFGIFFSESAIIALINFGVALVFTIFAVIYINNYFKSSLGMVITILNFGIIQILLMLAISLGSAFVASALPVSKIASKRPIDAIQNR